MDDWQSRHAWFKGVILPHEAALRKHVRRLTASSDLDVDDIVSETLVRAYTVEKFERIEQGRTFLFTVARNLLTDLARRRSVVSFELMANLEALEVADETRSVEATLSAREEVQRLQRVVDEMPNQCRRVLLLRRIEDLSMRQIAERLQLSVSTVEKHLSKAIAFLTKGMAEGEPVRKQELRTVWRRVKDKR